MFSRFLRAPVIFLNILEISCRDPRSLHEISRIFKNIAGARRNPENKFLLPTREYGSLKTTVIYIYKIHYAVLGSGWGLRQSKWVVATLNTSAERIERLSQTRTSTARPGIVSIEHLDWSQIIYLAENRVSGNCGSTSSSALRSFRDDYWADLR